MCECVTGESVYLSFKEWNFWNTKKKLSMMRSVRCTTDGAISNMQQQIWRAKPHHPQQPSHLHEGQVLVSHLPLQVLNEFGQRGHALVGLGHHSLHGADVLPLLVYQVLQANLLLCVQGFVEPLKLLLDALCSLLGLVLGGSSFHNLVSVWVHTQMDGWVLQLAMFGIHCKPSTSLVYVTQVHE